MGFWGKGLIVETIGYWMRSGGLPVVLAGSPPGSMPIFFLPGVEKSFQIAP